MIVVVGSMMNLLPTSIVPHFQYNYGISSVIPYVDSQKLECGFWLICAGFSSSQPFGAGGQ